jgi:hypothetical protein
MENIPAEPPHKFVAMRLKYRTRMDAIMMFIYTSIVYAWGLPAHPLGRDYEALATRGEELPFLAGALFRFEMAWFSDWAAGYHMVNLALLYACMLLIYFFTNLTVRGLWWFGTLAAVLFMANPVHTEAVMNLSGVADLVPCLAALAALTACAHHAWKPGRPLFVLSLALLAAATLMYEANAYLFLVVILLEFIITESAKRDRKRLVPWLLIGACGLVWHRQAMAAAGMNPADMFSPLYFLFYPIGFLPETARRFHEQPWLGWLAAAVVLGLLALIYRKVRRSHMLFGLLAMAAIRLYPGTRPIDPVHMVGGGQLLLANVFFNIALVGLCFRIMDNIKWRVTMVWLTTVLCIVFFVMQVRANVLWRRAGDEVRAVQRWAEQRADEGPIGLLPDYRYCAGAPMCLKEAISYDTPFSEAVPAVSLLRLHAHEPASANVYLKSWSPENGGEVAVRGLRPIDLAPWPYTLSREGESVAGEVGDAALSEVTEDSFTITIRPPPGATQPLPKVTLPALAAPGE